MKKSELKMLIREIVREEVAFSIKEVIKEITTPTKSIKPKIKKKHYSKNSVLNDVLNETAQGGEWKTMGGEEFTTERMNDIVGRNYTDIANSKPTTNLAASMGVNPDDPAMSFLNKDYSKVLKAVEKKKRK